MLALLPSESGGRVLGESEDGVVIGPPLMETTLATAIGKEAGTIIITGTVTFTMTTGQNLGTMVATLIFTQLIMLIMLDMMLFHHL